MLDLEYKIDSLSEKYYEEDSLKEGFYCPVCGDNGCHCEANIFFKIM